MLAGGFGRQVAEIVLRIDDEEMVAAFHPHIIPKEKSAISSRFGTGKPVSDP
jgi:hypothetical protein